MSSSKLSRQTADSALQIPPRPLPLHKNPSKLSLTVIAPNLARRLATRIIEGLQGRGRIVVVRGGTSALIRAIDDAIATFLPTIGDSFELQTSDELTQPTREALTLLASTVARTLLSSEHLEDVFADRAIVEREVFDASIIAFEEAYAAERARVIQVELDSLGYVAATAGKIASEEDLIEAFEHAADSLGIKLSSYDADTRQATFIPSDETCPDVRLELEEAVADELASLVSRGVVRLPVMERIRPLVHHVAPNHHPRLRRVIERVATKTLRRTGCSAHWELPDDRSIRVLFTPLSEQDARDVDLHISEFATEIDTILAEFGAPLVTQIIAQERNDNALSHNGAGPEEEEEAEAPESEPEPTRTPKRVPRVGARAKSTPRTAPKRTAAARTTKRAEPAVTEKKSGTRAKAAVKRTTTKKARVAKKG
jgi:hypothetical protein